MSSVVDLLANLRRQDIRLVLDGEKLKINAPAGALTNDIKGQLKANKEAIIEFLKAAQDTGAEKAAPIPVVARDIDLPLSFAQQRLWTLDQLQPGTSAYNMPVAVRVRGQVDVALLQKVVNKMVRRHESLRTTFRNEDGQPFQLVHDSDWWQLGEQDISELDDEAREERLQALARNDASTPFDLEQGPLFRASLIKLADDDYGLLANMHHIISDGWSVDLLIREIGMLYLAYSQKMPSPLPPLEIQYADFAHWQHQWLKSDDYQKQLDYWKQQLGGAPTYMGLPTDRPRPAQQTFNGAVYEFEFSADLVKGLRTLTQDHQVTMFMTLLAGYQLLLSRYSGQQDVCVGIPSAGRSRKELEGLIGFFINALVMRTDVSGDCSVAQLLNRVRKVALGAFSHQDLPADLLLDALQLPRNLSYTPLAQAAFALQNISHEASQSAAQAAAVDAPFTLEKIGVSQTTAKHDLFFAMSESGERLHGNVEYNTDLYDAATIEKMVQHFERILRGMVADDLQQIGEIALVDDSQLYAELDLLADDYDKILPLTPVQRDLYLHTQMQPETLSNSLGYYAKMGPNLDVELWRQALQMVTDRYDVLRTDIHPVASPYLDVAYQAVRKQRTVLVEIIDMRDQPMDGELMRAAALEQIYRHYSVNGALTGDHTINDILLQTREGYVAVMASNHILLDGVSFLQHGKLAVETYEALRGGEPVEYPADTFADYIEPNRAEMDSFPVVDFWREKLATVAPLEFSVSPFEAVGNQSRETLFHRFDAEMWKAMRGFCFRNRITPPLLLKCIYAIMIQSYCRADSDFMMSEITAGRGRGKSAHQGLGNFYQSTPFVFPLDKLQNDTRFEDLFDYVRAHQREVDPQRLISNRQQGLLAPAGRIGFVFNFYNFVLDVIYEGKSLPKYDVAPLMDGFVQFVPKVVDGELVADLHFDRTLFRDYDFLPRLEWLCQQVLDGAETIGDLQWVQAEEWQQQLQWNQTQVDYGELNGIDASTTIHRLIEAQVQKAPDALALKIDSSASGLSYAELNQRANQLAHHLVGLGVGADRLVGVCFERSAEMVIGMLAVLKAGGAYVPFDPSFPAERLEYMLQDTGIEVLLTQSHLLDRVPGPVRRLSLNTDLSQWAEQSTDNLAERSVGDNLFNVIYTSGSTGRPKGVMVPHQGIVNRLLWMHNQYPIDGNDKVLQKTPYSFDVSVWEFFWTLQTGATLVMAKPDGHKDPQYLVDLIRAEGISTLHFVPSMLGIFLQADGVELCDSIRQVFCSGEALPVEFERQFFSKLDAGLHNLYGPTEASVDVSYWDCERQRELPSVPIGKAVANTQLYVLDGHKRVLPRGIPGELHIGGIQLARGYLNREQLTTDTFIDNPLDDGGLSERLYRTGDLARFLDDGNIEYIGRVDFQVKVRGFRIELGEIEALLTDQADVAEVVVSARPDRTGNQQLVAYLVGHEGAELDINGIKQALLAKLPEYMVPSAFVPMDALPLSPNGKVNRKALPEPEVAAQRSSEYLAPRTETERQVAEIWASVLSVPQVGVHDNFFELGGQSLLATQVAARLRQTFEMDFPLRTLFEAGTVEGIAEYIETHRGSSVSMPPLERLPLDTAPLPLSYAQQRLWFLDQLEPASAAYNMPGALRISGSLDEKALQQVFAEVVRRHDVLRSCFPSVDGEAHLHINAPEDYQLQIEDLSGLADDKREAEAKRQVESDAMTPFDLATGPLIRSKLLRLAPQDSAKSDYILMLNMHHIVSDGWSLQVLFGELVMLYMAYSRGMPSPLPELPVQYADYAAWQRNWLQGEVLQEQLDYWTNYLQGANPFLPLPTDRPRPPLQTYNGQVKGFELPAELAEQVLTFARARGLTTFMVCMSAYQILLARYSGESDFNIGVPVSGRSRDEVQGLIGFFVNALVVRARLEPGQTMADLCQQVKENTLDCFAHEHVPAEMVLDELQVERSLSYGPLAQVSFNLLSNIGQDPLEQIDQSQMGDLSVAPMGTGKVISKHDMTLTIFEGKEGINGNVEFNTDLFDRETIETLIGHYQRILAQLVQAPHTPIDQVDLIDESELVQLLDLPADQVGSIQPLTAMQRDIVLASQVDANTRQNSLGYAVELHTQLDVEKWRAALQHMSDQHTALRTHLAFSDKAYTESSYQWVRRDKAVFLDVIDHSDGIETSVLDAWLDNYIYRTYAVERDELVHYALIKLADDHYIAVFATHHAILDGQGIAAHIVGTGQCYEALMAGQPLPTIDDAFPAFVAQCREQFDGAGVLRFWQSEYAQMVPLQMPGMSSVAGVGETNLVEKEARVRKELAFDQQLWADIRGYCFKQRITPALFFKCLFGLMIHSYCRPDGKFAVGEFGSGRNRDAEQSLGCFYQLTPFVFDDQLFRGDGSINDLFDYAKHWQDQAASLSAISLLAQRQLAPKGGLEFSYNFINMVDSMPFQGGEARYRRRFTPDAEGVVQFVARTAGKDMTLFFDYPQGQFDDLNLLKRVELIARQLVDGKTALAELQLTTPLELFSLTSDKDGQFNATRRELPAQTSVAQLFEQQVLASPDATALVCGDERLSYQQLNQRANQLAHYLQSQGVNNQSRVGICLGRSSHWLVAVLGAIKAGASYIPMDANYPKQRLAYMLEDSSAEWLISETCVLETLQAGDERQLDCQVLDLTAQADLLAQQADNNPATANQLDDRLYLIYTSGSTGQPKGAGVKHRGELNLLQWYRREYGITANDRCLLISAFGFDLTQKNLFACLTVGGTLVLPDGEHYDDQQFAQLIDAEGVTLINCAPSAFYPLVADGQDFARLQSLRLVLFGGEPIRLEQMAAWITSAHSDCQIINMYGPTECTDIACAYRLDDPKHSLQQNLNTIPIGRPNDNVQLYVLDSQMRLLPPGLVGELCIAGQGVGTGYLKRGQLTGEKFRPNPFGDGLLYRTGDLVRLQSGKPIPETQLEFVGRIDFQVKLRGLRIELEEVQFALRQLPELRDALALVKDDTLLAYAVGEQAPEAWRSQLGDYLPDYMVPSALVMVEQWPLTPNGKIDRNALLALDSSAQLTLAYVAPRNELERELVGIWSQVLKTDAEQIGVEHSFFELGGHSLLATQVVARVRSQLGVDLPLRSLFEQPTIAALAETILVARTSTVAADMPRIEAQPRAEGADSLRWPLSFSQQRLWLLDQIEPNNIAYHMPVAFRIDGRLNVAALQQALAEIVSRHEVLRTTIVGDGDEGYQVVQTADEWQLPLVDISDRPAEDLDDEIQRRVMAIVARPFNLEQGPLFRAVLMQLQPSDSQQPQYVFAACMHHIISDGWSVNVLVQELGTLYVAYSQNLSSPLPPLPLQYGDYAQWQRDWLQGEALDKQLGYWRETLQGVPVLDMPTDRPRPPAQSYRGSVAKFALDRQLTAQLKDLSSRHGATLFMTLLSGFYVLLQRHSGQSDLCIGTPIANRRQSELESLIGFFVNSLALRVDLEDQPSFAQLLERVKDTALSAYEHQDAPFEQVVEVLDIERDMSHSPLFQVMFILQNTPGADSEDADLALPGGMALAPWKPKKDTGQPTSWAKFDLTLTLFESDGELRGALEFATALFDAETVERFADHYQRIMRAAVQNEHQPVDRIELLPEAEQQRLLSRWQGESLDYAAQSIHGLIEQQVQLKQQLKQQDPQTIALVDGERQLSYAELNRAANQLARQLQQRGVQVGDLVGVACSRRAELVTALLAVFKAGAAYVPLDPNYPRERIHYMLQDSHAKLMITESAVLQRLDGLTDDLDCDSLVFDELAQLSGDDSDLQLPLADDQLAYVIYTSGSTGLPKGVAIEHRNTQALIEWSRGRFDADELNGVLFATSVCFDLSVWEMFVTLSLGGRLIIADNVLAAVELPAWSEISLINTVPSAIAALADTEQMPPQLRVINLAGEPLKQSLVDRLYDFPQLHKVYDLYGPSEDTTYSTWTLRESGGHANIGQPIANTQAYVLDSHRALVPQGAVGELYLAGRGLARGYLGKEEMTADKFVVNPFVDGERMYATGDLVRFGADGKLQYLGRIDHQVKIRGFRIELGEIEARLLKHEAVREAVVVAIDVAIDVAVDAAEEAVAADKRLVAYIGGADVEMDSNRLQKHLRKDLPDYMIPPTFVLLPELPLTPNGKVDRKALPAPPAPEAQVLAAGDEARNDTERELQGIWAEVLGVSQVGIHDNFFEMGGHSLLAMRLVSRIEKAFGVKIPLATLFGAQTVAQVAQLIENGLSDWSPLVAIEDRGSKPPLFIVHPIGGNVMCYAALSRSLGADQPVYGLQAHGFEEAQQPYTDLPEMAASYVQALREQQPAGPYYLAAHSFGGLVAFEMAQQLQAAGEQIAFLGMLDSHTPGAMDGLKFLDDAQLIKLVMRDSIDLSARKLRKLPKAEMYQLVADQMGGAFTAAEVARSLAVAQGFNTMLHNYQPQAYRGDIVLWRPEAHLSRTEKVVRTLAFKRKALTLGWEESVGEDKVEVITCPGAHFTMIESPHVDTLAEQLAEQLRLAHERVIGRD